MLPLEEPSVIREHRPCRITLIAGAIELVRNPLSLSPAIQLHSLPASGRSQHAPTRRLRWNGVLYGSKRDYETQAENNVESTRSGDCSVPVSLRWVLRSLLSNRILRDRPYRLPSDGVIPFGNTFLVLRPHCGLVHLAIADDFPHLVQKGTHVFASRLAKIRRARQHVFMCGLSEHIRREVSIAGHSSVLIQTELYNQSYTLTSN